MFLRREESQDRLIFIFGTKICLIKFLFTFCTLPTQIQVCWERNRKCDQGRNILVDSWLIIPFLKPIEKCICSSGISSEIFRVFLDRVLQIFMREKCIQVQQDKSSQTLYLELKIQSDLESFRQDSMFLTSERDLQRLN